MTNSGHTFSHEAQGGNKTTFIMYLPFYEENSGKKLLGSMRGLNKLLIGTYLPKFHK